MTTPPPPVQNLGPFHLLHPLGRGGMGVVYLAEDKRLARQVAVKVLLPHIARQRKSRDAFLREAQAAARINHPNTVTVYHVDQDGPYLYVAMEYFQGGSLNRTISEKTALDWRTATAYIRDAARGLAAIHAADIIHRDIKPANLMLTADKTVKVADFGLSQDLRIHLLSTRIGEFASGTPLYMSPEQGRNQTIDFASDIYSLCCTWYALLTGHPPFNAKTVEQAARMHNCDLPVDPAFAAPQPLPDTLLHLLAAGMQKNPAQRPESAQRLADELDELLATEESCLLYACNFSDLIDPPNAPDDNFDQLWSTTGHEDEFLKHFLPDQQLQPPEPIATPQTNDLPVTDSSQQRQHMQAHGLGHLWITEQPPPPAIYPLGDDLYRTWLDVPPGQRPPDMYSLLGVNDRNANDAMIHAAAYAQLDKLQLYALHPDPDMRTACDKLRQQVIHAQQILTNPAARAAYNQQLAEDPSAASITTFSSLAQVLTREPEPEPEMMIQDQPESDPMADLPVHRTRTSRYQPAMRTSKSDLLLIFAAIAVVSFVLAVAAATITLGIVFSERFTQVNW